MLECRHTQWPITLAIILWSANICSRRSFRIFPDIFDSFQQYQILKRTTRDYQNNITKYWDFTTRDVSQYQSGESTSATWAAMATRAATATWAPMLRFERGNQTDFTLTTALTINPGIFGRTIGAHWRAWQWIGYDVSLVFVVFFNFIALSSCHVAKYKVLVQYIPVIVPSDIVPNRI